MESEPILIKQGAAAKLLGMGERQFLAALDRLTLEERARVRLVMGPRSVRYHRQRLIDITDALALGASLPEPAQLARARGRGRGVK